MNLEQLCRTINENWDKIPDKKRALRYLRYQFELLAWKRQKLKLGAIVFEVKETRLDGILVFEDIEIRYIRQDTTTEDERKLENVLERLGWKWDVKNVIAMAVVIFNAVCLAYATIKLQYQHFLPSIAFRDERCDYALRYSFEVTFNPKLIGSLDFANRFNFWMADVFTDFCINFNVIF